MTEALLAFILIAVPVTATMTAISALYLWALYLRTPEISRSWLFRALYREDGIIAIIGMYYAYLVAARFLPLPMPPNPWGGIIFGFSVIVLLTPPIVHAASIWWQRRKE